MSEHQDRKYNINWNLWHLKDKQNIILEILSSMYCQVSKNKEKLVSSFCDNFATSLWVVVLSNDLLGHKVKDQHPKLATTFDQENGLNHLQNHTALTKT